MMVRVSSAIFLVSVTNRATGPRQDGTTAVSPVCRAVRRTRNPARGTVVSARGTAIRGEERLADHSPRHASRRELGAGQPDTQNPLSRAETGPSLLRCI